MATPPTPFSGYRVAGWNPPARLRQEHRYVLRGGVPDHDVRAPVAVEVADRERLAGRTARVVVDGGPERE
jgi:hypothetical protein